MPDSAHPRGDGLLGPSSRTTAFSGCDLETTPIMTSGDDRHATFLAWTGWAFGLVVALSLAILTPPFQVPDEVPHFLRAYEISELRLWSVTQHPGSRAGAELPVALRAFIDQFVNPAAPPPLLLLIPHRMTDVAALLAHAPPLDPANRAFIEIPTQAFYSPLPYVPQALAMAIGRAAGGSAILLFYLARLANAIVAVSLVVGAVRLMPVARGACLFALLLPMALFLYGSVSPDAVTIGAASMFTAAALRCRTGGPRWRRDCLIALAAGPVMCAVKPFYAPLLAISLPALLRRDRGWAAAAAQLLIPAVGVGLTVAWLASTASIVHLEPPGEDVGRQLDYMIAHPFAFGFVVLRTFEYYPAFHYHSLVGMLGPLTIPLPAWVYWLAPAGWLCCLFADQERTGASAGWLAAWDGLLLVGCCAMIVAALYVTYAPVGHFMADGVQGRYFLPLLPLLAAVLSGLMPALSSRAAIWAGASGFAILAACVAVTLTTVVDTYGLF